MKFRLAAIAAALVAFAAMPAMAQSYTAELSGKTENPANDSGGTGILKAMLDAKAKTLKWELHFWGMTGPATASHFHGPADAKTNAGVVVPLTKAGDTGPYSGTATLTDAQIADLNAGKWYVNVHSAKFGPGEIRGQVMKDK